MKVTLSSFVMLALASAGVAHAQSTETLPAFEEAEADTQNWREVDPENLLYFRIMDARGEEKGRVLIETAEFVAPGHVERFKELVRSGDLNGTGFHRVIDDFMAQGGDVEATYPDKAGVWGNIPGEFVFTRYPLAPDADLRMDKLGNPQSATDGYIEGFPMQTQSEFLAGLTRDGSVESWMPHCEGVVSTARTTDPNSASTQFFLMRETTHHLDRTYTPWGRVVEGQDVVDAIRTGEPVRLPDILISAKVVADMDESDRPKVLVMKTDGPAFAPVLAANPGRNVCDLPPVPTLVSG